MHVSTTSMNSNRRSNDIRYGLSFVSDNNAQVSIINGAGVAVESIYVLIFLIHAPKKEKGKIMGLLVFVVAVFSAVALVSVLALHGKNRNRLCGLAASIFSIIMYASPLSVMVGSLHLIFLSYENIIEADDGDQNKERGVYAILGVPLCFPMWQFLVSNGLGTGLGAMQLILYAIYRNKKGDTQKATTNGSLELGLGKPHRQNHSTTL
ncbi:unnamed protein product [Ilex paraguariensis]|uniref:Bidirectional sugar transporter SWEET n=1 Tax=Ilex paraguariensis TaxID=185542 RepID=A0ABC8RQB0_9AQUA